MSAAYASLPAHAVDAKLVALLSTGAVALGVLLSGFVLNEPAPYELYMCGLLAVWAVFGLRISRIVAVPLTLLVLFNVGGILSIAQMTELRNAPLYIAVSLFLALTAVFFAAVTESRPALFRTISLAWAMAALATASIGIAGYFDLFPGADTFTRYGRAAGVFEDPNVFGPFLAFPGVYLLHRFLTAEPARMPLFAAPLLIVTLGIFLSFSRGAWGLYAAACTMLVIILFLRSDSTRFRIRLGVMAALALALLALSVIVALQIPAVAELFVERARLVQDYDAARLGRFARFGLGFQMAMEHPLGIGPLAFGFIFGEDTHNIWLKALMDYGWLGFAAYVTLIAWTLAAGLRILFRDNPWQSHFICAYVVLVGHVALGTVIDTDHWRHFYLLLGIVWGGIALEARRSAGETRSCLPWKGKMVGAAGFEPTTP